jgi:hypothetical protein
LVVYPNPSSGDVRIEGGSALGLIRVYNAEGKLVLSFSAESESTKISLESLRAGLYLIKTDLGSGTVVRQ